MQDVVVLKIDFLSAMQGIQELYPDHPSLIRIEQDFDTLEKFKKDIQIVWILANVGIIGNDKASQAAKSVCRCQRNNMTPLQKLLTQI